MSAGLSSSGAMSMLGLCLDEGCTRSDWLLSQRGARLSVDGICPLAQGPDEDPLPPLRGQGLCAQQPAGDEADAAGGFCVQQRRVLPLSLAAGDQQLTGLLECDH